MSTGKKIAAGAFGLAVVLGGCNAILAAADKMKMTDPDKYTYAHDDAVFARLDLFGRAFFYSAESFTDADKLNAEGYKIIDDTPTYKPNAQIPDANKEQIMAGLKAKGVACPTDAISVTPINRDASASTLPVSSNTAPLKLWICPDYGNVSLKGSSIVVPLALKDLTDGAPQQIDETVRTDKCIGWGVTYSEIVNRDIKTEMQSAGLPFQPDDMFPVIIHMSAAKEGPCDTDSPNSVITQR